MKIPSRGKIYSINEGYTQYWDESVKQYVHKCKYPDVSRLEIIYCLFIGCLFIQEGKSGLNARYVGSMVADMHRTLKYGGIFIYPATSKSPSGKVTYNCVYNAVMLVDHLCLAEVAVRVQSDGIHY